MSESEPRNCDEQSNAILRAWFSENLIANEIYEAFEQPPRTIKRDLRLFDLLKRGIITVEECDVEGLSPGKDNGPVMTEDAVRRLGLERDNINSDKDPEES